MIREALLGKFDALLSREVARLKRRQGAMRQLIEAMGKRYGSATGFFEDLHFLEEADRRFLDFLGTVDWEAQLRELQEELQELTEDGGHCQGDRLELIWEGQEYYFSPEGEDRSMPGETPPDALNVTSWMADYADEVSPTSVYGEGVTYPILFSHEVEGNHRALASGLGWALLIVAWEDLESAGTLCLKGRKQALEVAADEELTVDELPGATDFGFRHRGELWRKLEQFDEVDPKAHWQRWFGQRQALKERQKWILREQGGATITFEVNTSLRRLRIIERPRSAVVRKRHNVFVDPSGVEVCDRYFANLDQVYDALGQVGRKKIDAGYRVVQT